MIKKATVKLDGLTVIAGENDTGKSSVGKVLFALIKADMISLAKAHRGQSENFLTNRITNFNRQVELLFEGKISDKGEIVFENPEAYSYHVKIDRHKASSFDGPDEKTVRSFKDATYIQTPLVWDLYDTFSSIANLKAESDFLGISTRIAYPYLLWDLYLKIKPSPMVDELHEAFQSILDEMSSSDVMNGEFQKGDIGKVYFLKNGVDTPIPLSNVASGIKSFGILQMLLQNGSIQEERILIFDEPEVHLHPKWQLKMAKFIVELVKFGIKVVVNSHSPYMIEALKRYSELSEIEHKTNFYLAENSYIEVQESLELIFEKLAMPMRELKELKWQLLQKH